MAFNFLKHKWQKIVLAIILVLVVFILIAGFFVNTLCSPLLKGKLKSAVLVHTDSLYRADFSKAEFHIFQRKIVIFNITLKSDSNTYNRLKAQKLAPNNLLSLYVKRLAITNINPWKLFFSHQLDVDQIILSAPEITLGYQLNHTKDTIKTDNRTPWQKISKSLKAIHVGDIFLNDVKFKYNDYSGNSLTISELKELNVHANDLLIDSLTQTDKSRLLYCHDVVAELNNYTGKTPSGLYTYTINYLKLSSLTSGLTVQGLTLEPVKTSFFNQTPNDRYKVYVENLQLSKFDFLNYHKYRSFAVSHISLDKGSFSLFTNPNKPATTTDKIKSFPAIVLSELKTDVKVDTISIQHLNIAYSEFNHKSKQTGTISFNNTSGRFLNVTNNKAALLKNNITTARLNSYFMGHGELNALFTFNLTDKRAAYTFRGNLGPMNLKQVNPAVMPLGMVKINSGKLTRIDFDFKANSKIANGKVTVLYNDLKITVLKADSVNEKIKRNTIASLYANIFIIKHDNPDVEGGTPRSFTVSYPRPVTSPFFNFTWKAIFTGLKPGVGFDEKKQEVTKALTAQSIINKQNRKIKKEQRKLRRAERKKKREEKKILKSLNGNNDM